MNYNSFRKIDSNILIKTENFPAKDIFRVSKTSTAIVVDCCFVMSNNKLLKEVSNFLL